MRSKNYKKKRMIIFSVLIIFLMILISVFFIIFHNSRKSKNTIATLQLEEKQILTSSEENKDDEVLIVSIEQLEEPEEHEQILENEENKQQENSETKKVIPTGYYIKVNYLANVVTIYNYNSEGELEPVRAMICSTGYATPKSGQYKLKSRWEWLGLQGDVYGHYVTQITGNILFHSVPYLTKYDCGSLEYWEFDKLGTSASLGCVRLQIKDTKWIYENCKSGTIVEFYADSNPGPLGKPSAPAISSNVECRNWDPTDTSSNNPWNNKVITNNDNTGDTEEGEKQINEIIENSQKDNTLNDNTIDENIVEENTIDENIIDENTINNTIEENVIENEDDITNSIDDNTINNNIP